MIHGTKWLITTLHEPKETETADADPPQHNITFTSSPQRLHGPPGSHGHLNSWWTDIYTLYTIIIQNAIIGAQLSKASLAVGTTNPSKGIYMATQLKVWLSNSNFLFLPQFVFITLTTQHKTFVSPTKEVRNAAIAWTDESAMKRRKATVSTIYAVNQHIP